MKKLKNTLLAVFALMLVIVPMALTGCLGGKKPMASLELFNEFKTEYYVGDQIDLTNGSLKYTVEGEEPEYVDITNSMVTRFNTNTVGQRTMVITYNGKSIEVDYKVSARPIEMEDMKVYYTRLNPEYNPNNYMLAYLNRSEGKLYVGAVQIEEDENIFDVQDKITDAIWVMESHYVTEEVVEGKLITVAGVENFDMSGGSVSSPEAYMTGTATITPNASGSLSVKLEGFNVSTPENIENESMTFYKLP